MVGVGAFFYFGFQERVTQRNKIIIHEFKKMAGKNGSELFAISHADRAAGGKHHRRATLL